MSYVRDAMVLAGLVCLGTGTYFYDWRLALVVIGATLIGIAAASALGRAS